MKIRLPKFERGKDICVKVPKVHMISPEHGRVVVEDLIRTYMKWAVILSPLTWMKAYELLKGWF